MTPVDFLINQIKNDQTKKALTEKEWLKIFEQAKQMEKQEIKKAYNEGYRDGEHDGKSNILPNDIANYSNAEQYYNQTYKLKHSLQWKGETTNGNNE